MNQTRGKSGVLLAALVSGALAAGTLGAAPSANATCASFWGINNGGGCTSKLFSFAIAIGTGADVVYSRWAVRRRVCDRPRIGGNN